MTITFAPLNSSHDVAAGVHRRRLRTAGFTEAGTFGIHRRRFRSYGVPVAGAGDVEPELPAIGVHRRTIASEGWAFSRHYVDGETRRVIRSTGFGGAAGAAGGEHRRRYRSWGMESGTQVGYAMLVAPQFMVSSYGGQWFAVVNDGMRLGAQPDAMPTAVLRDTLALLAARRAVFDGHVAAADTIALADDPVWTVFALIEDLVLFEADGTGHGTAIGRALERLLLSGVASHVVEAKAALIDALVLRELVRALQVGVAADSLLTSVAINSLYSVIARALDRALLSVSSDGIYSLTALIEDSVVLSEAVAHEADLVAVIRDAVGVAMSLSFDSGEYIAWVMNTQSKGLSRYTNYPFNSFGRLGGRYVGCAADGLHWLDGDTDNGEQINAVIRTSMDALGTRRAKRLPEAFIGYSSTGTLILKVILTGEQSGQREAAYYRLPVRPAESKREARVKIGRGLKAVDFAFQIENADGADFELDSIEFRPINLDRRTRG